MRKLLTLVCVAATLVLATKTANARETDPAAVGCDALFGRPLCFAATIVGSAVFLISLPVAATSHSVHSSAEALVLKPGRATFTRPLGDFDYHHSNHDMAKRQKSHKRSRD